MNFGKNGVVAICDFTTFFSFSDFISVSRQFLRDFSYLQTRSISVALAGNMFSGFSNSDLPIVIHFSRNSGSHDSWAAMRLTWIKKINHNFEKFTLASRWLHRFFSKVATLVIHIKSCSKAYYKWNIIGYAI